MSELRSVKNIGQNTKRVVWVFSTVTKTRARTKAWRKTTAAFGVGWSIDVVDVQKENTADGLQYVVTVDATKREPTDSFENAVEGMADKWAEAFTERVDTAGTVATIDQVELERREESIDEPVRPGGGDG